jgi:hypothetical protein
MNSNIRIFLFCPIPENQKPIIEFLLLQENSFLNWIPFSKKKYQQTLLSFSFFLFLACGIFLFPFFSFKFSLSFFLFTAFFFHFLLFFFFLILFSRWFQLEKRFTTSRVFYEEGSWYDGQIWEKPFALIKNERFLTSQKVQPILQRLSFNLLLLFFPVILFFLLLNKTF